MYLAELHGKLSNENENREDILTSNIFSFFKYANRNIFLYTFLKELALDVTREDACNAEFFFWPQYHDGTEPDLVLVVGQYYLLIEAKYHSGFGKASKTKEHQLLREVVGGRIEAQNLQKVIKLVSVTSHYYRNPDLEREIPPEIKPDFLWINWQTIALLIYGVIESNTPLPPETRLFAEDLYNLLLRKKLRNFEGVKVLESITGLQESGKLLFFNAASSHYRGSFIGFDLVLSTHSPLKEPRKQIFYRPQQTYFTYFCPKRKISRVGPEIGLFFGEKQ